MAYLFASADFLAFYHIRNMKINFIDATFPEGTYVATGTELLPLSSKEGTTAFVKGAILSGAFDEDDIAAIEGMAVSNG